MKAICAASLLIAGAGFAFIPSPAWSQTTAVGFTAGSFKVGETGALTYSIPIQAPPGRGGLEPNLALVYNSAAGNGYVGVGWSLQGFSTIHRCGRTIVQDNEKRAVRYDSSDRYCYGDRLVGIAGPYGTGSPSEYRTERESFTKVLSYGNVGGGPTSFQMQPKSGLWMEFGGTGSSSIQAQGKTSVRLFAVSRIEDYSGNYMTFDYTEDSTNGEYRPIRVNYTGSEVTLAPTFAKVELIWESRPDVIRRDVAGSNIRISQRLKNIQTFVDNKMVKDYRLAYEVGATTGKSRLISVTECTGDGTQCLVAAKFTYANYSGLSSQTTPGGHGTSAAGWRLADLFGIGRQIYYTHDGVGTHRATLLKSMKFNTAEANYTWSTGTGGANGNAGWETGDLFGNGRQMFYTHSTDGTHKATRLNSNGTFTNYAWTGGHGVGNGGWTLADLFGEGRKLYYTYTTGGTHKATRLNSNQTVNNFTWTGAGPANADWKTGDPFGDGRQLIIYFSGTTVTALRLSEGQSTPQVWNWNVTGFSVGTEGWRMADLFGDGRDVFYTNWGNGTHKAVRLNSDGSYDVFNWTGTPTEGNGGWELADLRGDGRTQYVTHTTSGSHTAVQFNPDSPATYTTWTWSDSETQGDGGWKMGDAFGIGRSVYYTVTNAGVHKTSAPYPYMEVSYPADLMITASVGVGQANVTVDYGALTDATLYVKDSNAVYPVKDVQGPIWIVRALTQNDGNGIGQQTNYFYTGAKAHLKGGGFLGFRKFDAISLSTGIKVSNTFRQDYPFHGQVSSVIKTTLGGTELSKLTNTYTDTTYVNSTGNYHRTEVTQSVTTSNDLNGAALPTVTATTSYDSHGNALTVNVSTSDGHTKETTNTYTSNTSGGRWILGRLLTSAVASTKPSPVQTLTRRSAFEYNMNTGLLIREIVEPNDSNLCLVTTYVHDSYGNRTSGTTRNCNGTSSGGVTEAAAPTGDAVFQARTSNSQFQAGSVTIDATVYNYPAGQFPTSSTNALNHSETRTFDPRFGGILSVTGPNALTTTWTYDKFGRKTSVVRADGTSTTSAYGFCGSAPNYCGHSVTVTTTGAPTTTTHHDKLNRIWRKEVQGFDGTLVRTDTEFDFLGRIYRVSQPYFASGTPQNWTTFTYDILGRPLTVTNPTGGVTTNSYNGLTTSSTNPLGQIETKTANSQGHITRVVRQ